MRFLMISNGALLAAFGVLYVAFGSRPTGYVVGGILCAAALGLWMALPLTDPYRHEGSRQHRSW